jgi:cell wall-associated NlpC family hydrolase
MNAREKIVAVARAQLGRPYAYDVEIKERMEWFDSTGLVVYCYFKAGIYVPRYLPQIIDIGTLIDAEHVQKADLVLFRGAGHQHPLFRGGVGHVGIYVGSDEIIEAVVRRVIIPRTLFEGGVQLSRFSERIADIDFRGCLKLIS